AVSAGLAALVHDLGRPARFHHMLRMAKPTSPMSMGTWLLTGYAPLAALAAAGEAGRHLPGGTRWNRAARPAGLAAAAVAPAVAAYTAVLLSHTAIPTWHGARRGLPFVFVGSAAAAAGGAALVSTPLDEAAPARRLAVGGAVVELVATRRLEATMGLLAEPFGQGPAGRYQRAARVLGVLGAGAAVLGCRHRAGSVVAGAALVAGSWCTRAAVFHAGQQSAEDPRYTVVPQRQRLDERRAARAGAGAGPEPHG
ncbi:MAG TPA: NrfD/PsrC family molybdoenzyme membrane anchor subunit, partial [Acidimicrobiales bacterium]|nr:NrfD/PsrC family molybdoenzyme membrane anchor subunit [Acidimicrobiales bacterium]